MSHSQRRLFNELIQQFCDKFRLKYNIESTYKDLVVDGKRCNLHCNWNDVNCCVEKSWFEFLIQVYEAFRSITNNIICCMVQSNEFTRTYTLYTAIKTATNYGLSWTKPQRQCHSFEMIDWLIYVRVSTMTAIWTVGHRLRSTPTNGHRFTALNLPWWSPIHVLTGVDVT